jgi:hypothetical protein
MCDVVLVREEQKEFEGNSFPSCAHQYARTNYVGQRFRWSGYRRRGGLYRRVGAPSVGELR